MSELPRLLYCTFDVIPGPSGPSRRLTEYLRELSEQYQVVVLSAKTPDHSHIQRYEGARLLRVPVGGGDLASRIQAFDRAVRRQLESEEYVLVHFTDPFGGYALCEQRESYGYRLVYEAHTFPSQELRYTHPQLEGDRRFLARIRRQELYCLMNADRVITGSEVTRGFIHSLGVGEDAIEVLRPPVDPASFDSEALGEPDGEPMRVLYLGSQVAWQGLPTLLRAVQRASREVDLRLVLVGPRHPDWQPLLEDQVGELGLSGKVEFQAPVGHEDLHKLLATADVGVAPLEDVERNSVQGGPLSKIAEYLAAGRPVIASDLPVVREVLDERTARFHPPGDDAALAAELVALARSPRLRSELGRAARAWAREKLDAKRLRTRLWALYAELLEGEVEVAPRLASGGEDPTPSSVGTPTNRLPASRPAAASEPTRRPEHGDEGTDPVIPAHLLRTSAEGPTDPVRREGGLPVVMGTPLRDPPPPPESRPRVVPQDDPELLGSVTSHSETRIGPVPEMPFLPSDEIEEVAEAPEELRDEPPEVSADEVLEAAGPDHEEPPELSPDELLEAEPVEAEPVEAEPVEAEPVEAEPVEAELMEAEPLELEPVETVPPPLPSAVQPAVVVQPAAALQAAAAAAPAAGPMEEVLSRLDPWFAQLAHGYCPPEGAQFARHTPPTNFPGRDGPPPPTVQPPPTGPLRGGEES